MGFLLDSEDNDTVDFAEKDKEGEEDENIEDDLLEFEVIVDAEDEGLFEWEVWAWLRYKDEGLEVSGIFVDNKLNFLVNDKDGSEVLFFEEDTNDFLRNIDWKLRVVAAARNWSESGHSEPFELIVFIERVE